MSQADSVRRVLLLLATDRPTLTIWSRVGSQEKATSHRAENSKFGEGFSALQPPPYSLFCSSSHDTDLLLGGANWTPLERMKGHRGSLFISPFGTDNGNSSSPFFPSPPAVVVHCPTDWPVVITLIRYRTTLICPLQPCYAPNCC